MMNPKQSRPSWLLPQWKLMRVATRDNRMNAVDLACLLEILDREMDAYGNARASWTHIVRRTGRSRSAVAESCAKLVALGYLSVARPGVGTRATEYAPHWNLISEPPERTASSEPLGRTNVDSQIGPLQSEVNLPSGPHIHVPQPPTGALTVGGSSEPEVAAPPPAARLAPAGGVPSGFEELWAAYGVRVDRAKARAAFAQLAPDGPTVARMLEAAERWAIAYDAEGRTTEFRKRLATWLTGECWLEDGPAKPRIPRPARGRTGEAASAKGKAAEAGRPIRATPTIRTGVIVATDLVENASDSVVVLRLQGPDGPFEHRVYFKDDDKRQFARLCIAAGRPQILDTDELVGCAITIEQTAELCRFAPAPANDDGSFVAALVVQGAPVDEMSRAGP